MARMREPVAERVVRRMAEATDSDAMELPTLYDAIDPEALETLVQRMDDGAVSFAYAGFEVTVTSDGSVDVAELAPGSASATYRRTR